ncbi:hypothetical protein PATSB16_14100 [Pandoraea thiooxydans]|nr:hypothetical protein PATSB16_14100 [Pandoraea thiooxydans]
MYLTATGKDRCGSPIGPYSPPSGLKGNLNCVARLSDDS